WRPEEWDVETGPASGFGDARVVGRHDRPVEEPDVSHDRAHVSDQRDPAQWMNVLELDAFAASARGHHGDDPLTPEHLRLSFRASRAPARAPSGCPPGARRALPAGRSEHR